MTPDQILASLSQLSHQKRPVTLVAIAFFSLVCLSLAGMQGWSVYKAREDQLAAADAANVAMTRALADRLGSTLGAADTMLADLAERIESAPAGDAQLARHLQQRLQHNAMPAGLTVLDESGTLASARSDGEPLVR